MAEYIEREAAISVIYGQHVGGKEACENARPNTYGADLREIVADIEDIPSADVQPVRHGRWIKPTRVPDSMLDECSLCGFDCGAYTFNYCPNCGALMNMEDTYGKTTD